MMKIRFPVSVPNIGAKEIEYVTDAVTSGWVSSLGAYVNNFEKKFAEYCGTQFALTTSNGTVALHLALLALDMKEGDEVIIPDLTFVATANAVKYVGAVPVFVDIDIHSYCIDPKEIERAITPSTRAIIAVHLYGHPAEMISIRQIADSHNLRVIEDAAEATGAEIDGDKVGSLSDVGTHSFYGNKIITCGEGGMLTTNSRLLYEKAKLLRDHAMSPECRYWHTEVGYNYRMTNLQAAVGLAQLERIDELLSKRRNIYNWYKRELGGIEGIRLNPESAGVVTVIWLVTLEFVGKDALFRDAMIAKLEQHGVDSRPFFYPMSDLPMFESVDTPVTKAVHQAGINLPTYIDMSEDDVVLVSSILKNLII